MAIAAYPRKRLCKRGLTFPCSNGNETDENGTRDSIVSEHRADATQRTLTIEYWNRSEECLERKWDHMDMIDVKYPSREAHILSTTLSDDHTVLEPNMFPYDTPEGIEHWTLWSRDEMNDQEVETYVSNWIKAKAVHVKCWNFDENSSRSIHLFHVHVYFQVSVGQRVLSID